MKWGEGEVDGLFTWEYEIDGKTECGITVCEAKTGSERYRISSPQDIKHLLYKLDVIQRCFPGRQVSYLLMTTPEYLFDEEHLQRGKKYLDDSVKKVYHALAKKAIPMMTLAYPFSAKEFAEKGQNIYDTFTRLHKRTGASNWEGGRVKVDWTNGVLDLRLGHQRIIYFRNEETGGWDLIEKPQRP